MFVGYKQQCIHQMSLSQSASAPQHLHLSLTLLYSTAGSLTSWSPISGTLHRACHKHDSHNAKSISPCRQRFICLHWNQNKGEQLICFKCVSVQIGRQWWLVSDYMQSWRRRCMRFLMTSNIIQAKLDYPSPQGNLHKGHWK